MPMLPMFEGLVATRRIDPECAALFDRHYSRQRTGYGNFIGPVRSLVLRDAPGRVLFAWTWPMLEYRDDKQEGYNCVVFRNESRRRSSEIILEAEALVVQHWGAGRAYTYVDPSKIRSRNPGYCFKCAGWKQEGRSKSGKILLVKHLKAEGLADSL